MNAFYTISALAMIVLLVSATTLVVVGRKNTGEWSLAGFLVCLVLNTIWSFIGPILSGMEKTLYMFHIGSVLFRIINLSGYGALLVYALKRRAAAQISNNGAEQ